jgi:hypothetical protein
MIIGKITYARMPVNVVVFPTVPLSPGFTAMTVTECSKVKHVLIGINSLAENRSVRRWLSARSVIELSIDIKEIRRSIIAA